jgi:hypothetical protein
MGGEIFREYGLLKTYPGILATKYGISSASDMYLLSVGLQSGKK